MKKIIEVKELTKNYNGFCAVNKISFNVKEGEIFAFLGPNGAGKSTTIKMMTTALRQSSGEIELNGFDVVKQQKEVRNSIGVIFQDPTLDDDLTAYENLYYHAVLYGVKKSERQELIDTYLKSIGLFEKKNNLVSTFSGGMKRRVEIARGLLHTPKILFLDEPTIGLDVQTRAFLWKKIREVNKKENITIFFTTHNMEEAESIATRIAIIDNGKILAIGTNKEIKEKTNTKTLEKAFLKLTGYDIREEQGNNLDMMRLRRRM